MLKKYFEDIIAAVCQHCQAFYGERLVSLAVFGSVARGTMRADSDIDLLLVADKLPRGRMARVAEFSPVEEAVAESMERAARAGINTILSPVFKTPEEVQYGSPLFLDMTDQAWILFDRDDFLADYLTDLKARLNAMGAKRVYRGGGYYWLLKPDLQPGEEIKL